MTRVPINYIDSNFGKKIICFLLTCILFGCQTKHNQSNIEVAQEIEVKQQLQDPTKNSNTQIVPCDCDVKGFIENEKITVYPSPKDSAGEVLYLKDQGAFFMHISASIDGWLQLSEITQGWDGPEFKKQNNWWIPSGQVFVYGPDNEFKYKVFASPNDTAEVVGSTLVRTWSILACNEGWIYIRSISGFTDEMEPIPGDFGWLPPGILCPNPFTNCADLEWEKYKYN